MSGTESTSGSLSRSAQAVANSVSSPVRGTARNEASGYFVMTANWFTGAVISPAVGTAVAGSLVRSIIDEREAVDVGLQAVAPRPAFLEARTRHRMAAISSTPAAATASASCSAGFPALRLHVPVASRA